MDRRLFLSQALPAAGLVFCGLPVARAADEAQLTQLAPGITLLRGFGGNVTMFDSPDGVLLVDGGSEQASPRLLQAVRELTGKARVHTLFNTHCHRDQVGSNLVLGAAGARIIAHENTRLWLGTEIDSKWEQRVYPRLPAQARPNQTFYTTGSIEFGGEQIDFGHMPMAHTDGDIYVHFRRANVLVAGDVAAVESYPLVDPATNGWIGGMMGGLEALARIGDPDTHIVPGHGGPVTRAQLAEQSAMLATVRDRLSRMIGQGRSLAEAVAARPTTEFDARWGDPAQFLANVWRGMILRPQELGQNVV